MLNEHQRNAVTQMALNVLRTGKMPADLDPETEEAVKREVKFYKDVIAQVGEKEFSRMTIDVGYDYD